MKIIRYFLSMLFFACSYGFASCANENTAITATTPSADFTIHAAGLVVHKKTGLMWMRCELGQLWDGVSCTGTPSSFLWDEALIEADGKIYAGFSDWRLPNNKELMSIVEYRCWSPMLNVEIFPGSASKIWSSSRAGYGDAGWSLSSSSGYLSNSNDHYDEASVRLVRDTTPSDPFITIGESDGDTPINFASLCNACDGSSTYSLSGDIAAYLTIDPDTGIAILMNSVNITPPNGDNSVLVSGVVHYGPISIPVTIRIINEF